MGLFDSSTPSITVAVDVLFPSNVVSGPGVAVDKTNSVWSVGLDYVDLTENTSIATPSGYFVAVWDVALARYEKVRLDNLNLPTLVDFRTPIGDANYAATVNDRYLGLTAQLTAIRTLTLPAASTVPPGRQLVLQDEVGGVSPGFYHSIVPTGADTINGGASWLQKTKRGGVVLRSNGANAWNVLVLEERSTVVDASYVASFGDSVIAYTALSEARTVTLPAASAYPVGKRLTIVDESGACSATFTIGIARAGSDTINGAANAAIVSPFGHLSLMSDGVSKWTILDSSDVASSLIGDASAAGRALLTASGVPAQRVLLRVDQHTNVADANYTAQTTDQLIAFTSITAARTVTLPAAAAVNPGQPVVIVDETGACSATSTITVTRSGTDTINGAASAVIASAFGYLELVSNGVNKWTLIDTSITSANIADASSAGRAILTAPSLAAERGIIIDQRTSVGDANYAVLTTDRYIATTAAFTAARVWTLPAANSMNPGQEIVIYDEGGAITATNTLSIQRSGSDTLNGSAAFVLDRAFQGVSLRTDGVSRWAYEDPAGPIDNTPVGATTPSTGAFTTLTATTLSAATLSATALGALPLRGYLAGLSLSNDGTSPNTVIDVSPGICCSDDATTMMSLGAFTKSLASAWSAGSGNGGLDTGAVTASTWYHVFVIERTGTGAVDVLLSLSATTPALPANFAKKRRIGSVKTDASGHVLAFTQNGDWFQWVTPPEDVNTTSLSVGSSPLTLTLGGVPTGISVLALLSIAYNFSGGASTLSVMSISQSVAVNAMVNPSASTPAAGFFPIQTNIAAQFKATTNAASGTTLTVFTVGWSDFRGRA
ncbi:MAG: hypothetical protein JO108_12410 [Acidobacteriaceae bacterium]|nr:hypothetical protein [Acidobacteriaceae bacterium]